MRLKVHFFALYRQLASSAETPVDLAEGATLSLLWEHVQGLYPSLQGYPLIAAVNGEQCDGPTPLSEGDKVAFLPPFSGGQP
ncbi:MAG: MoaD/ThiS family protein [Dehalococcoidia bacterium]|jgi:molybdopterin synthase catalytic subunit|nr:MoaD/ThiS family protein [Dehalococcoidia bacterium]MDP7469310.1 MoaD/ThiS family protein [Dehalococcoidia bacterium]